MQNVRSALKQFVASFLVSPRFFFVLLLDTLYVFFVYGIFSFYSSLLQSKVLEVTGGQSVTQLQQILAGGSAEQLGLLAASLRELAFILIGGSLLFVALVFFGFVASQVAIWHILSRAHSVWKLFWRWCGLVLLSFLSAFCLGAVFVVLQLVVKALFGPGALLSFLLFALTSIFAVVFLLFFFLLCASFAHDARVLLSFGRVFRFIFRQRFAFGLLFLFSFVMFVVFQLIQLPLQNQFFIYPLLGVYVPLGLFVVYIGWLRGYVAEIVKEGMHRSPL